MNCPRCQTTLTRQQISEQKFKLEIDQCHSCKGMWFEKGELHKLENIIEPVALERRQIPSEYDQLTALNCPSCTDHPRMEKTDHPRDEKVIMDICIACEGIWLDGGELAAIQKENWWTTVFRLFS